MMTPSMTRKANEEYRRKILAGETKCNCGGPQMGTDHSPDCRMILDWDEVVADVKSQEEDEVNG